MKTDDSAGTTLVDELFAVGAHFAYSRSRRHPSAGPFMFGVKNRVELFDLEETADALKRALDFLEEVAATGKTILLVGGKKEASGALKSTGETSGEPYVEGRFIGGTLTNFSEIRRRVDTLEKLRGERQRGELGKYTKRERLTIDREIEDLESRFNGLVPMKQLPGVLVVIDPKHEKIAVSEAKQLGISVVALANSDCDLNLVQYPVPGNDASKHTIELFLKKVSAAIGNGRRRMVKKDNKEPNSATPSEAAAA